MFSTKSTTRKRQLLLRGIKYFETIIQNFLFFLIPEGKYLEFFKNPAHITERGPISSKFVQRDTEKINDPIENG